MTKTGDDLYADLDRLRRAGLVDLRNMANEYATLNHKTAMSGDIDKAAFSYDEWGMDCVYGPWSELRDKLQNIFGHCRDRYEAAGDALVHIADVYQSTDSAAAGKMKDASAWGEDGYHVPKSYRHPGDVGVQEKIPPPIFSTKGAQ